MSTFKVGDKVDVCYVQRKRIIESVTVTDVADTIIRTDCGCTWERNSKGVYRNTRQAKLFIKTYEDA